MKPDPNATPNPKRRNPKAQAPKVQPLERSPDEPDYQRLFADFALARKGEEQEEKALEAPPDFVTASQAAELRSLVAEKARRRIESLNLYEPMPEQEKFHASRARVRLARGSNRGGKTLPSAVEVARAVCGCDPHGKYPKTDGRFFAVGKDLDHIGAVMYRKLFRAGAFKIIRDQRSGQWRAFRPWEPGDRAREDEVRPAPPLIPPRMVKEIAWEKKKELVPSIVRLHNGWELSFYSSLSKPPQGSDLDGVWMDEEIVDPEWVPEMMARLIDRGGCLVWSATPQAGTEHLFELHERAEKERNDPQPSVEEFVILLADNKHIGEQAKKDFAATLTEEELQVRVGGEFRMTSFKVYPEFSMLLHGMPWQQIPADWCRIGVVDPGHQVCAVLFGAVPPPHVMPDTCVLYRELYLKECDAGKFGEAMRHACEGEIIQAFLIDPHMAIHTELGVGLTVGQQYSAALRERGVKSVITGSDFLFASDDVTAGILAVHGWMRVRQNGTTRLRVLEGALSNFEWEMKRYLKKREAGIVTDKPNQKRNNHLMDCLRYLAMYDPGYVKPEPGKVRASGALAALREKQRRRREQNGPSSVNLGPGKGKVHA